MPVIRLKSRWASVGEIRFAAEPPGSGVDVAYYLQVPAPVPGARCEPVHTIVIDLRRSPEELLAEMNDTTRYEIRRADQKDGLAYQFESAPKEELLGEFCDFYSRFAARKGLGGASRFALAAYAAAGCLDLSRVFAPSGKALGWHVHYLEGGRARLLHSATGLEDAADKETRNLLGRANRWHHWMDLLRFRSGGVREFDFGGIVLGDDDAEQARIRGFKEKFGGRVVHGFNCVLPITMRGRLYSMAKSFRGG